MSVDLVPHWQIGDVVLTSYPFGVDADSTVDIGEPEMVVESVPSLMADGDHERLVRHGNRTYVLEFYIEGPTLAALAESEALLRAQLRRPLIPLLHDPGDGLSPSSVYEVQTAQLTPQRRDDHEAHLLRKFTLTLTCSPWARSASPVTVDAMVVGTTTVTVDSCDATTGWSGTRSGAGSPALGIWTGGVGVVDLDSAVTSPETWTLTRTGSVDLTSTPYLVIQARTVSPTKQGVEARADGVAMPLLAARLLDSDEWTEFTYLGSGAPSTLTFTHTSGVGEDWQGLIVREVSRSDEPPGETARQLTRIIEVGGTERTPASIHVSDPAGVGLGGLVIVHTSPEDGSGYSPPLRRWRTADSTGPETVDAGMLSGKREPVAFLAGGFVAEVPTTALPEGGYVLMARMRMATDPEPVNVAWSTSTIFPDTTTQQGFTNGSVAVPFATTAWHLVPLAALSLPSVRTKAGKVQIVIQVPTVDHAQVELDEAWLFRADDDCALTIVRSFQPDLWLDSPDLSSPVPRVWIGDGRDLQVHPGDALDAMGNHVLSPEGTAVFTAALADNPATEATFYRRWHSNAAE